MPAASWPAFAGLTLSIGITTGVFGMLAAHELVHSRSRGERILGAVMLTGMTYRHFRIAHVHVHHRYAATLKDSATARLGEGFYAFLLRTLPGQFLESWRFERQRCSGRAFLTSRIAVDIGPGLFTGLRVGVATAKALAAALDIPIVGCMSLDVLAHPHHREGRTSPCSPRETYRPSRPRPSVTPALRSRGP